MVYRTKQAFTMLEMLVVIGIIGVIAATILPRVMKYMSRTDKAKIQLRLSSIKEALTDYRISLGDYPTSREGLRALVENPRPNDARYRSEWRQFLKEADIADDKGNEFTYNRPPEKYKSEYKEFELEDEGTGAKDGF